MAMTLRLSIGPIPYFWGRQAVLDFYAGIAESAAEIVYLGEVVCSKRRELDLDDWMALGQELQQAGKEVVLSSLTLLEAASELGALKRLCANGRFTVEANDLSAIQLLARAGQPFVTGPAVNIYNARSLRLLADQGLRRWVLPVELGLGALGDLQAARPAGVETEVFGFGRLPLAWSARCYTARSHDLPKDDCRFLCQQDPDGRLLETREGAPFLVLNGIQTQSALTHEALGQLPRLVELGVDVLRLSPQSQGFARIIEIFDQARRRGSGIRLHQELQGLLPVGACNGYLVQQAGMHHDAAEMA
jgi:collagenase-like PrtC family protease